MDSSLLVERRRGPAEDRDLLLELPDTAARRTEIGGFVTASSRPAAVVDIVLSQPTVEGDLVDTELKCGLLDLAALADQSGTREITGGACGEPSMKTID